MLMYDSINYFKGGVMASAEAIASAIRKSELNTEDLELIYDACKAKSRAIARLMVRSLKPGDKVRVGNIRPKYMAGTTGVVLETRETKIEVLMDEGQYLGRFGRKIIIPAASLSVI
jgi:hypothetical protein